ncbi:MAG: hypothetical protein HY707_12890 [Ignavibacteriae bacterium]|nr:hypothetical protein [Ignavibacteriota bacterium]
MKLQIQKNILQYVFPAVLLIQSLGYAQDVRATARVDSNNILIGDWLNLQIEVQHPEDVTVNPPSVKDSLIGFDIVKHETPAVKKVGDRVFETFKYTLTAFDSGMYVIPPLPFQYTTQGDTTKGIVETSPIPVFVHGVAIDTTKDIKDIKPPLSLSISFAEVLPYLIFVVSVGALIWLLMYIRKKRKRGEPLIPEAPLRPAHELALEALRALEAERLWQRGKVKEYHTRLTDIVRMYIERRFTVTAMEMTTDEIADSVQIKALSNEVSEKLEEVLIRADLVKFAKFQPLPEENERSFTLAVSFVESTWKQATTERVSQEVDTESKAL